MNSIKKRIQITAMFQIAITIIAALVYSLGSNLLTEKALEKTAQIHSVSLDVMELLLLSNESGLNNLTRVEKQWSSRIDSISEELRLVSYSNPDEALLLQRLTHQVAIVNQDMSELFNNKLLPANRENLTFNVTLRLSKITTILANLRVHAEREIALAVTQTRWLGLLILFTYLLVSFIQLYNVRNFPAQ